MKVSVVCFAWALAVVTATVCHAETVRLHGATTVVNVIVAPHRDAVEKATGHRLQLVGNATGKGLVDLAEGKADAAMCSEPLEIAVAAAMVAGRNLDPKTLRLHEIRKDEVVFVVHPANTVTALSWEQLAAIHTGKVTNWKQLGGRDAPITVYSDAVTGGTRALVKKVVMKDMEYASAVRPLASVSRVAEFVRHDPNGVGAIGRGFADPAQVTILKTAKVERPLGFVTLGAPSPKVSQVIDAFRAAVGRPGQP